jgi:hypothetical protein
VHFVAWIFVTAAAVVVLAGFATLAFAAPTLSPSANAMTAKPVSTA